MASNVGVATIWPRLVSASSPLMLRSMAGLAASVEGLRWLPDTDGSPVHDILQYGCGIAAAVCLIALVVGVLTGK